MISLLCPTRERADQFRASCHSLYETAIAIPPAGKTAPRFEVLAYIDDDDPQVNQYMQVASQYWFVRLIPGSRHGYQGLHSYYNELARRAKGDHLLLWNDDARMLTRGWNQTIAEQLDPQVPAVGSFDGPDYALFPVVTRAFYETLGHFSLSPHCDGWVQEVAKAAGCIVDLSEIRVEHLRDELDDDTKRDGERVQLEVSSPAFFGAEMTLARFQDTQRIREALQVST
jgi:hypothetical protein